MESEHFLNLTHSIIQNKQLRCATFMILKTNIQHSPNIKHTRRGMESGVTRYSFKVDAGDPCLFLPEKGKRILLSKCRMCFISSVPFCIYSIQSILSIVHNGPYIKCGIELIFIRHIPQTQTQIPIYIYVYI